MSANLSARLEKLRWPVTIIKLRKGQKYSKILKTIANFNKTLLKFKILGSSKPFHCLKRLSSIPISSFKLFHWLIKIHKPGTIKIFQNLKFKFNQKIAIARVIKRLITTPLTLETMQQFTISIWRRPLGPWCRKKRKKFKRFKIQKAGKNSKYFKNC